MVDKRWQQNPPTKLGQELLRQETTQAEFAKKMGVSRVCALYWCKGERQPKLHHALNITMLLPNLDLQDLLLPDNLGKLIYDPWA